MFDVNTARRIRTGSKDELMSLTDREPADPYAHLEATLVLVPKCSRAEVYADNTVFEAYLRDVEIVCLNRNAGLAHLDECRSSLGPLEAASNPFWFTQSSNAIVSEFAALPNETDAVRAFEHGLVQLLGITPGNCSFSSLDSNTTILKIVHQDTGFHGTHPTRQMRFHSLRVHELMVRLDGAERPSTFVSTTSRAMYALDGRSPLAVTTACMRTPLSHSCTRK